MSHIANLRNKYVGLIALLAIMSITVIGIRTISAQETHEGHGKQMKMDKATSHAQPANTSKITGDIYPLDTCPVSGEKLGSMGDPVTYNYNGREIRFCCKGCVSKFENDPDAYLKKTDAKIAEQQKANYPLNHCVVQTDEKISKDESESVYKVIDNRLFVFCCKDCEKKVKAAPDKYIDDLNAAVIEKQKDSYKLDTCVVSGEKLGGEMGEPINYVYNGNLVRFCCKGCIKQFEKNPQKYTSKLMSMSDQMKQTGHQGSMMKMDGDKMSNQNQGMMNDDHSKHSH